MQAALVGLVPLVVALSGCAKRPGPERVQLKPLGQGLDYDELAAGYSSGPPVTTYVLRLDPTRWALRHVTARHTGQKLSDARGFREAVGAAAAVNGIYFDPAYKPLGLMVSEGKQLSRLRRVDHGVFTVSAAGPQVQHARRYSKPAGLDFAAECGPRLVVGGKPLTFKPGLARRTALGHDARGQVYVIATSGVVSLGDFADFLARPVSKGGLGLEAALNLDGGSSTMFDLHWGGEDAAVRSAVEVPAGVAVVRRDARDTRASVASGDDASQGAAGAQRGALPDAGAGPSKATRSPKRRPKRRPKRPRRQPDASGR